MALILGPLPVTAQGPKAGQVVLEAKGYLVAARQVSVSPKVAGQVVESRIEEGKRVKAGEVLARLDPAEHEAGLRLARAKLRLAEAQLRSAKSQVDPAIAQAKVEVAQARVALAQHRLECTVVRAPCDGTVLVKRAEVGTMVNPAGFQVPASLCDLEDSSGLEVDVWIGERDIARVAKDQPCLIRVEAFPQKIYRGRVARLLPVADRAKGAVGVRIRIEMPPRDEALRPELGAIVTFLARE
jgi:multidrug resistance efflux pump